MIQNFDELQGHDPVAEEAIASLDDAPVKDEPNAPPVEKPKPVDAPKSVDPPPAVQ